MIDVAWVSNILAPYRLHLQVRAMRELQGVELHSLYLLRGGVRDWQMTMPDGYAPVFFDDRRGCQPLLRSALREWHKGGRVMKWMRDHHVRAVLLDGYAGWARFRILLGCSRVGIPVFIWGDSNDRSEPLVHPFKRFTKHLILRPLLRTATGVLACGSLGTAFFQRYGVPREKIHIVPVEPDYTAVEAIAPELIATIRNRLNLTPERRRIIYSGRLVQHKRVDLLIEAFSAISGDRHAWDLLIVGSGPAEQSLKDRVPRQLRHRVHWAGHLAQQQEVTALYKVSDVLVLPSDYEPWALVINEAAAAGLAIVASDMVGAAAELVRDGVNGYTFPRGNLTALVEVLKKITAENSINAMKRASPTLLAEWRQKADPIEGLRQALRQVQALQENP